MDQQALQSAIQQQQNPKQAEEQMKKQQEILEKRNIMLNQLLTQGAKERCIFIYNN
jgi:DNA-binding TFAR19-related protein (PDSD5 family)